VDYGKIVNRSVTIVWENKFLIILGFLAALGSGTLGSGGGSGGGGGNGGASGNWQFPNLSEGETALAVGAILAIICVLLFVGIILWVVSTIARGGLIASVDNIEDGQKSSFREAWAAGRDKAWTLLGIGIIPAIPSLAFLVIGLFGLVTYGGMTAFLGEEFANSTGVAGLGVIAAIIACIVVPIALLLTILRTFAERACMLEGLGAVDSYRRGAGVLRDNLGQAIVLFLLQIAIFIVLGIVLFLPGVIAVLCCLLWPLIIAFQGAVTAAVSAAWTLAWRTWTGEPMLPEKAPAAL
jgi:hypothetical protein